MDIEEMISVMRAYAEGKTIIETPIPDGEAQNTAALCYSISEAGKEPLWNFGLYEYHIKKVRQFEIGRFYWARTDGVHRAVIRCARSGDEERALFSSTNVVGTAFSALRANEFSEIGREVTPSIVDFES